ncbi:MAG: hypothetical protein IJX72_04140 [Clostridia bacterium]|nr:hypothetical protein [Clostridia bacterium]
MRFREDPHKNESVKAAYLSELEALIARREDELAAARQARCADILKNGDPHRKSFTDMLGWPLNADLPRPTPRAEVIEELGDEGEYTMLRMKIEVMEGLWLSGLYLRLNSEEDRPLVIAQHGGAGTPELISGFYFDGSTVNYHDMVTGLMPHRVHIFMPALLLWDPSFYGQPYDRVAIDGRLKRIGGSITALEVYSITRAIDYFEATLKPRSFGMVGLSYGGHYTLFTTAAETRIRSAISGSFFSDRRYYAWADWSWKDAAALYDDAEIACLCYPRRLCVKMGDHDELFAIEHTRTATEAVKRYCQQADVDPDTWFDCIIFDGIHEYGWHAAPVERLIRDLEA